MSVNTADLCKAINAAWDAAGLDAKFQAYWDAGVDASRWEILNDQQAAPGQPYPYCVMGEPAGTVVSRMSGGVNHLRHVRDVNIRFDVYAKATGGSTAKEVAADLAEEIMKVFGGHPTDPAGTADLTLDNGKHLTTELDSDWCVRLGDDEYMWAVSYLFKLDVPVAV